MLEERASVPMTQIGTRKQKLARVYVCKREREEGEEEEKNGGMITQGPS